EGDIVPVAQLQCGGQGDLAARGVAGQPGVAVLLPALSDELDDPGDDGPGGAGRDERVDRHHHGRLRLFGDLADQLPVLADDLVAPAPPVDVDHAPRSAGPRRGDRVHGPAVSDGHADLDVATDLPRRAEGLRVPRALVEMLARSRLAGVRPVPARRA